MRSVHVPPRSAARDRFGRSYPGPSRRVVVVLAALAAPAVLGSACARTSSSTAFEAPRTADRKAGEIRWNVSDDERLGGKRKAPPTPDDAADARAEAGLAWDLPKGWSELPPSAMRAASFRAGAVECWLTLLAGEGGGLLANANRWRAQVGASALGEAELAALERVPFLGGEALFLDATGRYTGMGGEAHDDWRLVGLLRVEAGGSAFLKMVGPAADVAAELDAFGALARSFRAKGARASDAPAATGDDAGLAWSVPDGWRRGPERATRVATFLVGERDVECTVTTLAGDGGGALANVNRWRGQLGLGAIDGAELARSARVAMLGTEGVLVELESADRATRMLGALATASGRSVYAKLVGPAEDVAAARDAFVAFAGSIRERSR